MDLDDAEFGVNGGSSSSLQNMVADDSSIITKGKVAYRVSVAAEGLPGVASLTGSRDGVSNAVEVEIGDVDVVDVDRVDDIASSGTLVSYGIVEEVALVSVLEVSTSMGATFWARCAIGGVCFG